MKFACSWKKGESYSDKQQFSYLVNRAGKSDKWSSAANIAKGTTSRSVSLSASNYYPYKGKPKITEFKFRVRGISKKEKWSDWVSQVFKIEAPAKPSLSVSASETNYNQCTFTWSVDTSNGHKPFADVEFQTKLVTGYDYGGDKGWSADTGGASGSKTYTETASTIASGSHTRWFRVRARGAGGASEWCYASRVYSAPNAATNVKGEVTNQAGGMQVKVTWSQTNNSSYPVNSTTAEYAIKVPGENLTYNGNADGVIGTMAGAGRAASSFIGQGLEKDECLFVRVSSTHLYQTTYSGWVLVRAGSLIDPEITDVKTDDTTHRATITANNKSEVPGAFLVVQYRTGSDPGKAATVGIIPAGQTQVSVQCPDWSDEDSFEFGVYACVGSFESTTRADGVDSYTVTARMKSDAPVWQGGQVPHAPENVKVNPTSISGTVKVVWDWTWREAQSTVLSWADHEDAWESTSEPETYTISNTHAGEWNVSGLETGKRWYFRVRLAKGYGENLVYGAWSKVAMIDLSSAPSIPTLMLSKSIIPSDGSITCFWSYVSGDGTGQAYAEVCEAKITGDGVRYDKIIGRTETSQHLTLSAKNLGWASGEMHYLCVRVVSASGRVSDEWSDPVPITIAEELAAVIDETNLVEQEITVDDNTRTVMSLAAMPLTVHVTGAGIGGTTILVIERAEDYHMDRPDESDFNGFEGETILFHSQTGEDMITVNKEDLIGILDDGASYRLIATVQDSLGQSAEARLDFEVHWSHQAVMPEGHAEVKDMVSYITPIAPEGYQDGDTCDIYRLSADQPELIVSGGSFGTTYVDPYPAIGEFGGHRIVYRTKDGDYITKDNEIAWLDLTAEDGDSINLIYSLIDFDGEQIEFRYDVTHSNTWEKDFKETRYLGGSVTGDWNKAVGRTASLKGSTVTIQDQDTMRKFRRLAAYPGICHLRTVDGSSFKCDIQVSEDRRYDSNTIRAEYSLSVTRVDPEELDGLTLSEWLSEEDT
ncbi:hypothetical protein BHK98_02500 [Hornefia porci]|uniref:Fibronectin type-III domain-containing protein n=2 Tax=Hornefia porci TaxID=2652292 RepID=A0A1Q9JFR9_9FIRM|nr:hypothetical protein BHK98_02500 [Hornefia porci]